MKRLIIPSYYSMIQEALKSNEYVHLNDKTYKKVESFNQCKDCAFKRSYGCYIKYKLYLNPHCNNPKSYIYKLKTINK